jgi:tRNA-splicing ligase RtcB (3'-phosphate/5'-hydroxy nucleic acid ligase)
MGRIINIFGKDHDEATKTQLQNCVDAEEEALGVLCADGHLGYSMPIGGVVAYQKHISPSGVGYDIACGNMAVRTEIRAADLTHTELERIADEINKRVSFGIGRVNNEPADDEMLFSRIAASPCVEQRKLLKLAQDQLGTVGSGNHYVDLLEDQDGFIWIAVHFGSRGFGHRTACGFLSLAKGKPFDSFAGEGEMMSPPILIDLYSPLGGDYIAAMQIAGEYAYSGRRTVVATVLDILGNPKVTESIHNHHNFAWNEIHGGKPYWVVRKGATPAFPNQLGFVGGSMGDISVILKGKDTNDAKEALYSTIHGAGRVMSRRKAKGRTRIISRWKCLDYRKCDFSGAKGGFHKVEGEATPKCPKCGHKLRLTQMEEQLSDGLVNFQAELDKLSDPSREDGVVIVRGAGADEAPPVYRKLIDVLEAHANTIEVQHIMKPRVVVMAGKDVYDPFKD